MRILIIYIFCTNGGVETALKNRIKNILPEEMEIDLLFFEDFGGQDIFNSLTCNIIIEPDLDKIGLLIASNQYDAIISIDTPEIFDLLHKIKYKGKVGLEVHTTYADSLNYLKSLPEDLLSFIIVPSQYQKKLVSKYSNQALPIYVLPNSVDMSIFKPIEMKINNNCPIVAWIGRLDEHKNWKKFIEVAQCLAARQKFEFWLIGGMHADSIIIEKFLNSKMLNNLQTSFRWLPYVPYDNMGYVYNYVAKSGGCYISTSINESFGMTVIEAMSCRCPVVCNNVGALTELLNEDRGLLFDNESTEMTSARIIEFLSDEAKLRQTVQKAYQYVRQSYNEDIIQQQYVKILTGQVNAYF